MTADLRFAAGRATVIPTSAEANMDIQEIVAGISSSGMLGQAASDAGINQDQRRTPCACWSTSLTAIAGRGGERRGDPVDISQDQVQAFLPQVLPMLQAHSENAGEGVQSVIGGSDELAHVWRRPGRSRRRGCSARTHLRPLPSGAATPAIVNRRARCLSPAPGRDPDHAHAQDHHRPGRGLRRRVPADRLQHRVFDAAPGDARRRLVVAAEQRPG